MLPRLDRSRDVFTIRAAGRTAMHERLRVQSVYRTLRTLRYPRRTVLRRWRIAVRIEFTRMRRRYLSLRFARPSVLRRIDMRRFELPHL